jgi:membrane protein DedA with SNARE-associated domain
VEQDVLVMLEHAQWLLFAWVFGNQAGVPVTVVPVLLGAGALAGSGRLSLTAIIAVTVVASLGADLTWYGLGWWHGPRLLKMVGHASTQGGRLLPKVWRAFTSHHGAFQLSARFLPELNPIAAGLAGATRSSMRHFICRGTVSAVTWAGAWIGCGYFLNEAVLELASRLGDNLVVLFLAPATVCLFFHCARRWAGRRLRQPASRLAVAGPLAP